MLYSGRGLLGGSVLLLALVGLTLSDSQALAQGGGAAADVKELAKLIKDGKPTADKVAELKKKHGNELEPFMHLHKAVAKKGLGTEKLFLDMGKNAPGTAALAKRKNELVEAGYINLAIGEVAAAFAPEKPRAARVPSSGSNTTTT